MNIFPTKYENPKRDAMLQIGLAKIDPGQATSLVLSI